MKQQHDLIPMTTGELLKQERSARKLSLADVARAINLDEKLLDEIESEQTTHLAPVYLKGYIRAYARYLQIGEDKIQALVSESGSHEPPIQNIFAAPPKSNPLDKWLRATSYVLASLLIGTLAWQFSHEAVRLSQDGSQLGKTTDNRQRIESTIKLDQAKGIRGTVNASIAPLGALHGGNAEGIDAAEQAWAAVSRPPVPDGESRLKLVVSADSWVEITDANGQQIEMDLLRGGSEKGYHGKPPFRILLGRASAVRLTIDGEPVDLTGYGADDIAQLTWPKNLQADNSGQDEN
jgi:cytoskeleton protein RodZ